MLKGLLNRRVSKRVAFKNEMSLLLESNGRAMALATATNVSSGGIQFYVPEGLLEIQPGEELELIFHLPEIGEVNIRCAIRYLNHGKDRDGQNIVYYGGKFLDITVDTLKGLQVFCEEAILEEKPVEPVHPTDATHPAPRSDGKNLACYLKENPDPKKMLTQESIDRLVTFLLDSDADSTAESQPAIQTRPTNVAQPPPLETPAVPDAPVATPSAPDCQPLPVNKAQAAANEAPEPPQVATTAPSFPGKPGRPRLQDIFGLFGDGPTISNSTITSLFNDRFAEDSHDENGSLPPLNYMADPEGPVAASQSAAPLPDLPVSGEPQSPAEPTSAQPEPNVITDFSKLTDATRETDERTPTPLPALDAPVGLGELELPAPPPSVIPALQDDAQLDPEAPGTIANRSRFQSFFNLFHNNGNEKTEPPVTTDLTFTSSYSNNEPFPPTAGPAAADEPAAPPLERPAVTALDSIDTTPVNTLYNTLSQTAAKSETLPAATKGQGNPFVDFGGFESPYQKLVDQIVTSMVEPEPAIPVKSEPPAIQPSINSVGTNPLPALSPEAEAAPVKISPPVTQTVAQPVPKTETVPPVTNQPDPAPNVLPKAVALTNPVGTPTQAPKPAAPVPAKNFPFNSDLQHPELAGNDTVFNSDQSSIDMLVTMLLQHDTTNTGRSQAAPPPPAKPGNPIELSAPQPTALSEPQADERPALPPLFQHSAVPGGMPANNTYLEFLHSMPEAAPEVTKAAPIQEPELPADCSHIQLKEGHSIPVFIEDLNIGGITVRLSESVPEGVNVLVNLAIEGFNVHNIIANCEWIGRSQNSQFLAGFIFRQLTPEQTSLLRNMIQRFTS